MITIEQLAELATAEPVEPRGWFRWLHNHYLGRYGDMHSGMLFGGFNKAWQQIADKPEPAYKQLEAPDLWVQVLNRHAWTAGIHLLTKTTIAFWSRLDPFARSAFFAGLTERDPSESVMNALLKLMPSMRFSAETLCQLACNAIKYNRMDLLNAFLKTDLDLTTEIERFVGYNTPDDWEAETLTQVSHRVIDMLLEAALFWNNCPAMALALEHGASPDIPIWQVERSYNDKHCALSFALAEKDQPMVMGQAPIVSGSQLIEGHALVDNTCPMVRLLLDAGADPAGNCFAGRNSPLFYAAKMKLDDIAEELVAKGASFAYSPERENTPVDVALAGCESMVLPPWKGRFFGYFPKDLDWIEQEIGCLIPLVPISAKQAFHLGGCQGGQYQTILGEIISDPERIRRYEALGLDTQLASEELCRAINRNCYDSLHYLLARYGDDLREKVFAVIWAKKPEFGATKLTDETNNVAR